VITNQFSAEYGRASGGRVNLRTRSGSKQFHGRGFYFFRDEALNANTFRNNSLGIPRLPLQEHDWGFTLGGPIYKETVFLVSYERDHVLDSALIDTLVPVKQNPVFPLPSPTAFSRARLEDAEEPELAAEVAGAGAPSVVTVAGAQATRVVADMTEDKRMQERIRGFIRDRSLKLKTTSLEQRAERRGAPSIDMMKSNPRSEPPAGPPVAPSW